jgi:hypothetical protein
LRNRIRSLVQRAMRCSGKAPERRQAIGGLRSSQPVRLPVFKSFPSMVGHGIGKEGMAAPRQQDGRRTRRASACRPWGVLLSRRHRREGGRNGRPCFPCQTILRRGGSESSSTRWLAALRFSAPQELLFPECSVFSVQGREDKAFFLNTEN